MVADDGTPDLVRGRRGLGWRDQDAGGTSGEVLKLCGAHY
jgi:hypothetical protein